MSKFAVHIAPLLLVPWMVFGLSVHPAASASEQVSGPADLIRPHTRATPPNGDEKPIYTSYKGVTIGMAAEEARKKLGNPKEKSDEQDFYVYSDFESVQVVYDEARTVTGISVNYLGDPKAIPTPLAIFGTDAPAKPDGSIFKLVRYPQAGFWLSYNRTAGEDPMIIITMQKLQGSQ